MPQYFSPGVYIQEVETGPVPIQGVSTSITGAVGITAKGPTSGKPVLLTSFGDFQNTFGGFLTPPPPSQLNFWLDPVEGGTWWQFPLSVKGYFDNGGQQLYVKRVYSSKAVAATGSLGQGLIADLTASAAATDISLQLSHLFGISKFIAGSTPKSGTKAGPGNPPGTINILVNGAPIPSVTNPTNFQVPWYDPSSRSIGLSSPDSSIAPGPGQALKPNRDLVVIMPLIPYTALTSPITGKSPRRSEIRSSGKGDLGKLHCRASCSRTRRYAQYPTGHGQRRSPIFGLGRELSGRVYNHGQSQPGGHTRE
jgi:hypothetical protein